MKRSQLKYELKKYGLTIDEYEAILSSQGGVCGICAQSDGRRLSVDHCHDTGEVRGLLCNNCNRALGLLGDSTDAVQRTLDYLMRKPKSLSIN